jgi:hypothetical protein
LDIRVRRSCGWLLLDTEAGNFGNTKYQALSGGDNPKIGKAGSGIVNQGGGSGHAALQLIINFAQELLKHFGLLC